MYSYVVIMKLFQINVNVLENMADNRTNYVKVRRRVSWYVWKGSGTDLGWKQIVPTQFRPTKIALFSFDLRVCVINI